MTEEERAELERQKDWVKHRYNCTMKAVFSHLFDVVNSDVESFSELDRKTVYECTYAKNSIDVFLVLPIKRDLGRDASVRFARHKTYIQISPGDGPDFEVTPQWDEDDLECRLLIEDKLYTYPQISQKAIGSLLFNGAVFPSSMGGG